MIDSKKPLSTKDEQPVDELNYEQAFAELESIVRELESGEHPLEQALALFERGHSLSQRCLHLLDNAELKVKILTAGELKNLHNQ